MEAIAGEEAALVAEVRIMVVARVQLQLVAADLAFVAAVDREHIARGGVVGAGRQFLLEVVGAEQQRVVRRQRVLVLPVELAGTGAEQAVEQAVLAGFGAVLALGDLEMGAPVGQQPAVDEGGQRVQLAIHAQVVGRLAAGAVVRQLAVGVVRGHAGVPVLAELVLHLAGDALVLVRVVGRVRADALPGARGVVAIPCRGVDRRIAVGLEDRTGDVERGIAHLPAIADGALARVVAAVLHRSIGRRGLAGAALGEDLHHAADGVGAIQGRDVAAHHLDMVDLVRQDIGELRGAAAGAGNAHAIHQDQHLVGIGAAHEQRGVGAHAARGGKFHARLAAQQRAQVRRLGIDDVFLGDHRGVRQRLGHGLRGARGGDDDRGERLAGGGAAGLRRGLRVDHGGQGNGRENSDGRQDGGHEWADRRLCRGGRPVERGTHVAGWMEARPGPFPRGPYGEVARRRVERCARVQAGIRADDIRPAAFPIGGSPSHGGVDQWHAGRPLRGAWRVRGRLPLRGQHRLAQRAARPGLPVSR
ncbi:hypothetical protein D3C81_1078080 [compost metagenome]